VVVRVVTSLVVLVVVVDLVGKTELQLYQAADTQWLLVQVAMLPITATIAAVVTAPFVLYGPAIHAVSQAQTHNTFRLQMPMMVDQTVVLPQSKLFH
jgi:hypothetical protein